MEEFEWNVQHECHLLESMIGHKPIGINKSFQMFFIYDKFIERVEKEILSELIWAQLETMYNLEALDESESIPFPNEESDFELPDTDFAALKEMKVEEIPKNIQKGRETPKNMKEIVKRDDKTPNRNTKEVQRRDSKDSKSSTSSVKKEEKKEPQKQTKPIKGRTSSISSKEDLPKAPKIKNEESGRAVKRPTRGSLKPEDGNISGKASPVTVQPPVAFKRRRI